MSYHMLQPLSSLKLEVCNKPGISWKWHYGCIFLMHLCQPLALAVFGPLRTLLKEWHGESHAKGTLLKQHFSLLLNHLFNKFKDENLVSGFIGSWICPLNEEEVLKRMNLFRNCLEVSWWDCCKGSARKFRHW